jgi:hypothetical protein
MKVESTERATRGRALARAAAALIALAACALAMSPKPPPDRLLGAFVAWVEGHASLVVAIGDSSLAILLGAGGVTLLALAIDELIRKLRGAKTGSAGRRRIPRRRLLSSLFAYALLLVFSAILRRLPPGEQRQVEESPMTAPASGYASGAGRARGSGGGLLGSRELEYRAPIYPLMAAGAVAAGIGTAVFFILRARRMRELARSRRLMVQLEEEAEDAEAEAVAAARRELEADLSPRAAIIRCYAAMCGLFARASRFGPQAAAPSLTARELADFLRSKGAGEPEIAALTAAFEKARYSNEDCGEVDRAEAARALAAIESAYGGSAA